MTFRGGERSGEIRLCITAVRDNDFFVNYQVAYERGQDAAAACEFQGAAPAARRPRRPFFAVFTRNYRSRVAGRGRADRLKIPSINN